VSDTLEDTVGTMYWHTILVIAMSVEGQAADDTHAGSALETLSTWAPWAASAAAVGLSDTARLAYQRMPLRAAIQEAVNDARAALDKQLDEYPEAKQRLEEAAGAAVGAARLAYDRMPSRAAIQEAVNDARAALDEHPKAKLGLQVAAGAAVGAAIVAATPTVVGYVTGVTSTGPVAGGWLAAAQTAAAAGVAGAGLASGSFAALAQSVAMSSVSTAAIAGGAITGAVGGAIAVEPQQPTAKQGPGNRARPWTASLSLRTLQLRTISSPSVRDVACCDCEE
jgi:hypothetical protein